MTQQDEFASRLTTILDDGVKEMDAVMLQRLAVMRRHAVSGFRAPVQGHGVLVILQRHGFISALLVLALLFSGWWYAQNSQPAYSAETDILLLTGDLPPNAYADKTFTQWLETRSSF